MIRAFSWNSSESSSPEIKALMSSSTSITSSSTIASSESSVVSATTSSPVVSSSETTSSSVADVILADVSEGLALSQKEKLASLAENVEFESESNYREKLATLRDSYFSANPSAQRNHSENISEGAEGGHQPEVSGLMESYLQTLNRVSKK